MPQECMEEKLTFIKYLNEKYLFYGITLLSFTGFAVLLWILSTYTYFEKKKLPRGNTPVFPYGNMKDVVWKKTTLFEFLWRYYNRFKRKGYKLAGLFLFTKPCVLVMNQSVIYRILNDDKCFENISDSIVTNRNINYRRIDSFMEETFDTVFHDLTTTKEGLMNSLEKTDQDLESCIRSFFLESFSTHFGLNSCEIVEEINALLKSKTRSSFLRYLRISYPTLNLWNNSKALKLDLKEIVEEIVDNRKKNDIRKCDIIQSFIDMYNIDDKLSLDDVAMSVFDIYLDNMIWSYNTTLLCLIELALNDDIQEELIGEIRRFNKKNVDGVNSESFLNLIYLDAVVKETLRKYPQVPVLWKKCTDHYKNADLNVELCKNTFVFISILGIHRDSNHYTSPEKFDPDRFSEDGRKCIKQNTFLPFGFGPICQIGLKLTTFHTKLCIYSILSKYSVHFDKDSTAVQFDPEKLTLQPRDLSDLVLESH